MSILTWGEYYILECRCFNSVGFYDIDMEKVILKITEYVKNKKKLENININFVVKVL